MKQEIDEIIMSLAEKGVTDMNSIVRESIQVTRGKYNATDIYYYIKGKLAKSE